MQALYCSRHACKLRSGLPRSACSACVARGWHAQLESVQGNMHPVACSFPQAAYGCLCDTSSMRLGGYTAAD